MPEWTEIQRVAWALGADDCATDVPPDTDTSDDSENFRQWAERVHGPAARMFVIAHEALQTARFGPETSPEPFTTDNTESTPETAERFARQVQALIDAHDDDWEIRDDQIVTLATRYAAQFLPGGLRFPTVAEPTRCARALAGPNKAGRYTVLLLDHGQIGAEAMDQDFATHEQAQQAAHHWNAANGVTEQRADEILDGPKGPIHAGTIRIESVP